MKKHARKASISNFKITASEVFDKIDERFNRQEEFNMTAHSQMQDEIRKLGGKIDMQINTFNLQLSKLNDNMEKALSTLNDHEQRITALEGRNHDAEVTKSARADFAQKALAAAKSFWWLLVVLGAAYGVKPFLKVFNLFSE